MRTKRDIYASELAMLATEDMDNPAADFVMIPAGTEVALAKDGDHSTCWDIEWWDADISPAFGGKLGAYVAYEDLED